MIELDLHDENFRNLRLFQGVSPESIEHVIKTCSVRHLQREEVLLAPGQANNEIYLLLSGTLRIHLETLGTPALTMIQPGECVGEMSIIDNEIASAFVVAAEKCTLLSIHQEALWQLIHLSHQVARNLLFILSRRMRFTNEVIVENAKRQTLLEHYARVDPLTGLYNRRWMDESLSRQMLRCQHSDKPLSLIMMDVDRFKAFNDTHGHLAGDFALITLAQTLSEMLRPGDFAARYGGEEFIVVLPETSLADGFTIAERLRSAIAETEILTGDGSTLPPLTISAGIATTPPATSIEELIATSDKALYQAKDAGRNRVFPTA
ncbi:MAG: GGDEF domain-containing protein [Magnetococcales bacterium]|nr:GGDEF domain-containing protein [Magnetococcales bacterium]MBF0322354.1 GGDEF domain-containing protein [Magnetococcales bacterium]